KIAQAGGHTLRGGNYGSSEFDILLDYHPSGVVVLFEQPEKSGEVDCPLSDDGENFFFDRLFEGELSPPSFLQNFSVYVLDVQEAQAGSKLGRLRRLVSSSVLAMARIQAQTDSGMRGHVKEAFALLRRLHISGHMRMKYQIQAELGADLGGLFDDVRDIFPLR